MKIVFRVDSGLHMGIGHVMRCLTLGNYLKDKGNDVFFITKNNLGFIQDQIKNKFPLFIIDGGVDRIFSQEEKDDYNLWLGEDWSSDLKKTNDVLAEIGNVDLVVVDHYSLDAFFEKGLISKYVMVIDDLMNRKHCCNILLDQNITANLDTYKILSDEIKAQLLIGPTYALLRSEFAQKHQKVISDNSREIKKVLIFFGAFDPNSDCLTIAKSLRADELRKFEFTFILNSTHRDFSALSELLENFSNIRLLSFVDNFADLMLEADLFIGAGGTTSWERACLGVATALLSVAENQIPNCEELYRKKICHYLGPSQSMNLDKWRHFFNEIILDTSLWYAYRSNSYQLVDGLGTKRVAEVIEETVKC